MSNATSTIAELAIGLASVSAIAGYHLFLPSPGVAFSSAGFATAGEDSEERSNSPIMVLVNLLRRWASDRHAAQSLMTLDDHLMRDIGLTRGIMVPMKSADGRPRGLIADMIEERLRRF
jgi:uncharacterized protein YjiS (DUF1127 family)